MTILMTSDVCQCLKTSEIGQDTHNLSINITQCIKEQNKITDANFQIFMQTLILVHVIQ